MQITRLRHYPAAQGYTHMRTHCRSPTEWTNRIPFKPNTRWNHTHYDSVFSGWVSAKSPGWWISGTVSHILLFCSSYLGIYKNTRVCAVMTMKRWRKKNKTKEAEEPFWVQDPVACRPPDDRHAAMQKAFAPTGPAVSPSEAQHVHQYSFHPSTVDGFWLWKVAGDERTWQHIHKNGQDFQHI